MTSALAERTARRERAERAAVQHVIDRLTNDFPHLPGETVSSAVHAAFERYDGCRVRDFLPILVERGVKAQLSQG